MTTVDPVDQAPTRAARRRERVEEVVPPLDFPLVLVRLLTTLALAGLAVLAVHAGSLVMMGWLVWTAAGLAWGWPSIAGLDVGWRVSAVTLLTGVLAAGAVALVDDQPVLRLVPIALAVGIVVTFLLQLVRSDGRQGLTTEVAATASALGLIGVGSGLLAVSRVPVGPEVMPVVMGAVAAASLVDLAASRLPDRAWLVPMAMVVGGAAGLGAATALGSFTWGVGLLLGMFVGALSLAVRSVIEAQPGGRTVPAQVSAACASVLSVGALAHVAELVLAR